MKRYYPYAPSAPTTIYGEEHVIENGQILLNHIPLADSIEIEGFRQTNSAVLVANQFYCAYGSEYYYREANCIVRFNELHNGETVRVKYQQVGTIITANDMNEIKAHLENSDLHSSFVLPAASAETRGGIRVGHGLSISDDVLSADADNYTLPSATPLRLGGVVVESDENISRTIERYFPTSGETLPVHTQTIATRDSLGVVKIGNGLSIDANGVLSADAQNFTLTPATTDSLGGIKVGNSLTITNGVLNYNLPNASTATKGGVVYAADNDIANTIERYFPSVTTDTEIIPVLTSIPVATAESIGGVKIGNGLSITEDGLLSAEAQTFTLTPATRDSLGGVKIGARLSIDSLGVLSADTVQTYTLPAATADSLGGVTFARDADISAIIDEYFPTVSADEIIPVLTSIPVATNESLGGVIIGEGLTISENGILSADAQTFTLAPATHDSLGGIKVGDGLSITGGGVLSALAQDFTLKPATSDSLGGVKIGARLTITENGILSADAQDFTLTAATTDSLGGVKIVDDSIIAAMIEEYFPTVSDETIAPLYSIPAATYDSLGGIIPGVTMSIEDGVLDYYLPTASSTQLGGVKVGRGLTISDGILSADAQDYTLPTASASTKGGIKIGHGLTMTGEVLSADAQDFTLKPATSSQLGGVKIGARLSITADGILSADSIAPYTLPAASDEEISSMIEEYFPTLDAVDTIQPLYEIPIASATTLGGVKIGKGLTMTGETLSANADNYTLPTASSSQLGGVKVGRGLTITDGILSADAQDYTLPTASSSQLGGVRIGNTLSMSSSGVLNYNLPNATSAALGGVIAGNTLTITNGTLNYNLPAATTDSLGGVKIAGDEEISEIIERYFPASIEAGTVMGVQFVEDSDVNSMLATVFSGS